MKNNNINKKYLIQNLQKMMEDSEIAQKLINLLLSLSEGEENLLKQKQEIIDKSGLNPIKIFFYLDKEKKGFITKENLMNFLLEQNIPHSIIDVNYLYYFYDKDNDNALDFNELLNLLIPDSNYFYKIYFKQKYNDNNFNLKKYNQNNTDYNELNILASEIQFAKKINEMIQNIKYNSKNFSLEDIYLAIKGYSFITAESLKAFFDRYKIKYSDKDIVNIFNRFNTINTEGRINYNQLKNFFGLNKIGNHTTREKRRHYRINSDVDIFKKRIKHKKPKELNVCAKSYKDHNNYYENKRAINFNKNNNKDIKKINYKDCSFANSVCYNDCNDFINLYNDDILIDIKNDNSKNKNYSKNYDNNLSKNDYSFLFKEINFNKINGHNKNINRNSSVRNINYKDYLKDKRNESLDKSYNKSYSRRSNVTPKKCSNCQGKFKNNNDVKINLSNKYNEDNNIKNNKNVKDDNNNSSEKEIDDISSNNIKDKNNGKTDVNNIKDSNIFNDSCFNDNSNYIKTKKSFNYNISNSSIYERENYNPQNYNLMNYNNYNNSVIYSNNNMKSIIGDDDITLKLPARLDRRLVKRKLPERINISVPVKQRKVCCDCRKCENNNNCDNYVRNGKYNKYERGNKNYNSKYKKISNDSIYEKTKKYEEHVKENKNHYENYKEENSIKYNENNDNYYKKYRNKNNNYYEKRKDDNKNEKYEGEENNNYDIYEGEENNNNYDKNNNIYYYDKQKNNGYNNKYKKNVNYNEIEEENNSYNDDQNDNNSGKNNNFCYIYKKAKPKNSINSKRNENNPNFADVKEFTFKDNDSNFSKKHIDYCYY